MEQKIILNTPLQNLTSLQIQCFLAVFFLELNVCNLKQFFKIQLPSEIKAKFRELIS